MDNHIFSNNNSENHLAEHILDSRPNDNTQSKITPQSKFYTPSYRKSIPVLSICLVLLVVLILSYILGFPRSIFKPNIEDIKDSVVMIEAYDSDGDLIATGSGFCAYEENWIITNFHVVEGARWISVITDDGEEVPVTMIALFNKKEDLAILETNSTMNPLPIGDGNSIQVKDKVTAIGSPMGELNTVSEGIVSNADDSKEIRITAPISHGSSGGVLLDESYRVIGITSAGYDTAQNLNFAININVLEKMHSAYQKGNYGKLTTDNYKDFMPNIVNHNENKPLEIKQKSSNCPYYNYTSSDLYAFYLATDAYQIFNSAMWHMGVNGFNVNYKNMSEAAQREAAANYSYLLRYETETPELTGTISDWAMEEFIIQLDLMTTYELAIFMTEVDIDMVQSDDIIDYLNDTWLSYEAKIIINRLLDPNDDRYNSDIVDYFNADDGISYDQEVDLLKYLGMRIDKDGKVYW